MRVGCSERIALKQAYHQGWNRSPAQVGGMRQVLRAGALGRPRGMGWGGRWEGGSGWRTHVNPWLIHISVWQKPLQYCKVISLQLIKINEEKEKTLHITLSRKYKLNYEIPLHAYHKPPPGDLPSPGTEPRSATVQADSLPSESPGKSLPKARYWQYQILTRMWKQKELTLIAGENAMWYSHLGRQLDSFYSYYMIQPLNSLVFT